MTKTTDSIKSLSVFDGLLNYYTHEGLNLIPLIHGDKKPVSEWKKYQQRKITKEEINTFFLQGTQHNIGVVCGAISDNLYVIDFDTEEMFHRFFTKTDGLTLVKTGRGYHVYFKAESPVKTLKMLDSEGREIATLKGEGSYVVGPPSLHPSGTSYEFIQRGEIPRLTGDVRQQVIEHAIELGLTVPKEKIDLETLLKGVPAGNRDNSLMYLIHFLRRAGISKEDALKTCKAWNKRNNPPLEDVSYKVEYHYELAEPYRYFYSLDPGLWNITEGLTLEKKKKSKAPKEEKEKVEEKKEYSEDVKQRARMLINDPAFLFNFGKDLEKGMFMPEINKVRYILGEEETKRHLGVNLAAARMDRDTINIFHGGFATVKDTMVKMLFRLTGARYVRRGYLTAAGFRYSKEIEGVDVLYLPEADLSGEKGRQMRFMRTDDGGFEFEYSYKSKETGLMVTETQKVGIKTIVITTNDVTFDGAIVSGGWLFESDNSKELTEKVVPEKLKDYVEKRKILSEEEIEIWNCAFDILTESNDIPEFIKIPYAPNLVVLFDLKRSESRRSPEKVGELIRNIAILRRYQKPEEYRDRADVIDLFIAMRIGKAAISETVSELTKKEHDVYDTVKKLEAKNKAEYTQASLEDIKKIPDGATVKQISMVLTTFPSDTCYRLAESIFDKGLFARSKKGRENEYFIKCELTDPSEVGITRMQSLETPKDVLKECVGLVYGKNHLGNSEKGMDYINNNTKIVDPITGIELYLRGFSESDEMKNDETKETESSKKKKGENESGIRVKPRLRGEKEEEEEEAASND